MAQTQITSGPYTQRGREGSGMVTFTRLASDAPPIPLIRMLGTGSEIPPSLRSIGMTFRGAGGD